MYLKQKFSRNSETKIKAGVFVGPQIKEIMADGEFNNFLNEVELRAWRTFKTVVTNFI